MRLRTCLSVALVMAVVCHPADAQNDAASKPEPLLVWHFDDTDALKAAAKSHEPGPRPPVHPGFKADNTAFAFTAKGPTIGVSEADTPKANLRFTTGDSITLEAWVKVNELKEGAYAYLIGKGRNGKTEFAEKNQNYALRLKGDKGGTRVSFLFGSEGTKEKPSDWHRWTSDRGFTTAGWHHVAVVYTFGKPKSVRGYIDGEAVAGTWDMGGATERAPISDADAITIGTGNGGGASNSFLGLLDDLTVWRAALPDEELKNRYQFVPPPPAVKKAEVARGRVTVQLCEEGLPARNAWPDVSPSATETYPEVAFGFFTVPHKYVDTGVRGDRGNPYLLRAAAVVTLPKGKHRLLLRGRGASRLYVDDKLLLTTPFPTGDGSGHGDIRKPDSYLNLGPDFRFAPPGDGESWATFDSTGGEHLVVMESVVGSFLGKNKRRAELGETVVAISEAGSESWRLLTPDERAIPYTDSGWRQFEAERTAHYEKVNAEARAALRKEQDPYWKTRRAAAAEWLKSTPEVAVPEVPKGYPAHNPIDHFLAARIETVKGQTEQAKKGVVDFYRQVRPILEAKCAGCHTGDKPKGGLRLDSLASAIKGGKSDGAAITPGKPAESSLLVRVKSSDAKEVMPPKGDKLTADEIKLLETWIGEGANWPDLDANHLTLTPLTDDLTFLRRVFLDTVGVVPTPAEVAEFVADTSATKRAKLIDKLLADPRAADHGMGYWLDVLAENPNILNPTLNNTGPFRWWLHESLLDNKPLDLFVTELVRMRGSSRFGGPAGFGVASQNDVPMAAKGTVISAAFLGVEMKCARCHDAPAHASTQQQLFQLAAMLETKPLKVPATSSVPLDKIHDGGRAPLIQVTLKPGTEVPPEWPFAKLVPAEVGKKLAQNPDDSRDRLAALLTAPQNERFAQVMANRLWARLMGRGLVEPVDDWERGTPTHPELLRWLARELVRGGYDTRHVSRLILNSHAYQRSADAALKDTPVLYTAPARRRLTAEQVVDSLFVATGKPFRVEEVSLDVDGARDLGNSISLGKPRRSWMLTSTSNERDRPSLALPRIQAVTDVLQAFGWRATRQDPTSVRDTSPNVLQPAILHNGTVGVWLTRPSDDHGVTALALKDQPVETLVDELFLKLLTRKPTAAERKKYTDYLSGGYADRMKDAKPTKPAKRAPKPYVSWSNHLHPQATTLKQQEEADARAGDPPTDRLDADWRGRLEDVLWVLVTSTEFVFTP
jgi:mono/diheme cytochrome c family protein